MHRCVQTGVLTIDLMVLVAAIAVGLAGFGVSIEHANRHNYRDTEGTLDSDELEAWSYGVVTSAKPLLLALTLVLPVIQFMRRPRPCLFRAIRQPGMAACFSILVVLIADLIIALGAFSYDFLKRGEDAEFPFQGIGSRGGEAVASVWLILVVSRAVRVDRGWIDRTGILVGASWIVYLFDKPASDILTLIVVWVE